MGLKQARTVLRLAVLLVLAGSAALLLTAIGPPPPPDTCEPFGLEPDPETYCVSFTNVSGATAGFLHVQAIASNAPSWTPIEVPAACGEPKHWSGFEFHELVWPAPCVDPGETVAFEFSVNLKPFSPYFAPSPPVVEMRNESGRAAHGLRIDPPPVYKGIILVENAPGCDMPSITSEPSYQEFLWDSACVDPGEMVIVHFGTTTPVTTAPYVWLFPPLFGDASCDETVDAIDAALVLQYEAELLSALACTEEADVNGDGDIDAKDALLILQFSAGLLPSLPP